MKPLRALFIPPQKIDCGRHDLIREHVRSDVGATPAAANQLDDAGRGSASHVAACVRRRLSHPSRMNHACFREPGSTTRATASIAPRPRTQCDTLRPGRAAPRLAMQLPAAH